MCRGTILGPAGKPTEASTLPELPPLLGTAAGLAEPSRSYCRGIIKKLNEIESKALSNSLVAEAGGAGWAG